MPRLQLLTDPDDPAGADLPVHEGEALLCRAGVRWGRAAAPLHDVSSEPRLRHARALIALQRRFGPVDHVRRHRCGRAAQPALAAAAPQTGRDELLLVVEGRCTWQLPAPAHRAWLRCTWEALEWFTRPVGAHDRFLERGGEEPAEWLVLSRTRRPGLPPWTAGPDSAPVCSPVRPVIAAAFRSISPTPAGAMA